MSRAKTPTYKTPFRRRREGKTNYAKRLALVKSGKPRMVVRKTNAGIIVQFIEFNLKGDKTLAMIDGHSLKKGYGWPSKRNYPTAYLAGLIGASKAKEKGVKEFILDAGLQRCSKGSVLFAAVKGAVDAGLKTNYDEEMLSKNKLENVKDEYKTQFEQLKNKFIAKV